MDPLIIEQDAQPDVAERAFEIVERKGLGHPDSICDAAMDAVSVALSRHYLERFGRVLHHNCDKGMIIAGRAAHRFGGGRILKPMTFVLAGRATRELRHARIDVDDVAVDAVRRWFATYLPRVDLARDLRFQPALEPGSEQLTAIFAHSGMLGANDTSAAVGYAPLSETERLTLLAEAFLNDPATCPSDTGQDVKVMSLRRGRQLDMTVAVPLVDALVADEKRYFERKEEITALLQRHLEPHLERIDALSVRLNALDAPGGGADGSYLTVVGTSAESADSGAVGRGNRVNGLIAPCRPRGAEAAAGKNPVSHIGKIYNVASQQLAERLVAEIEPLRHATVWLVSGIGDPIDQPRLAAVRAAVSGASLADVVPDIRRVYADAQARLPDLVAALAAGEHRIC